MFDTQDDLYKLIARFNQFAVQEIASTVSQISGLLQRYHLETSSAIEGVNRKVDLIHLNTKETHERIRRQSDLLEKIAAGISLCPLILIKAETRAAIPNFHNEIETLKRWLKVPPNTEDDFTNFKARKMNGTCQWVFHDPQFQAWRYSDDPASALLWIHARAGRGKSVLAATIVQHLQHQTRDSGDACVYFFCRSDDEAKKTPHAILRSTAYWLAQRNETIRRRLMKFVEDYPELRIDEIPLASLWDRLFMQCICDRPPAEVSPFRIYWIVDALDECDAAQRLAFTKMLAELGGEHCGVTFRLLFLSRYVNDIAKVAGTENIPTLNMKVADNDHDIQQFITTHIRTTSLGSLNETDRATLIATLKVRANGSFLWAKLVMEQLEGRRTMRAIEEALKEIPANQSLENLYQAQLDSLAKSLDQEDIDLARQIFMWTLCAPRPLSLEELTAALEASMETKMMDVERAVKETCGSLIEVVDAHSQKDVMAIHITLREFMHSGKATGQFAFSKADAHAQIAKSCLTYLLQPQFSKPFTPEMDVKMDPTEVAARHRLLRYSCRFWSYHLVTNLERYDPDMNALILRFLQSRNVLTSIEAIATFGGLVPLLKISDDLYTWLTYAPQKKKDVRQWISVLPIEASRVSESDGIIARWALDFRRIQQRFQQSLRLYPRCIHDSLTSFCPTNSMIFQLGKEHTEISIANSSSQMKEWDNLISMFRIPGFVRTMVCSPKRPFIAAAVDSRVITIYDAETGQAIRPLKGHEDLVYALAYSKDDMYLASGGKDGYIIVWNVERGNEMFKITGHTGAVHAIAYSHNGEHIASGGEDSTVRIWQIAEDGARPKFKPLVGHTGTVYTLKYHRDNTQLCSSAEDGFVVVWNAPRGTQLRKFNANLKWMGRLSFNPSWHYMLTSSEKTPNNVDIWNVETSEIISKIVTPSQVRCWKYSPGGKYILTGHLDGLIRVWDPRTTDLLHTINEDAWSLRFSNSGKYLICLIRYISRWQVRTWDFETEMHTAMQQRQCGDAVELKASTEHRVIAASTVNKDNSRLATVTLPHAGTWKGRVKLWNPVTAEILWEHEQIFQNQDCVAPGFSPDGRFLACFDGKDGGGIFVVDAVAAKVIERVALPPSTNLVSLAIGLAGSRLAVATREVDLFEDNDTPSFYLSQRSDTPLPMDVVSTCGTQNSMTVSYTADGKKLILAARDRNDRLYIMIWDTNSRQLIKRIVHDQEKYVWFKMFGGFKLHSEDRIVIHVDYMPLDAVRRSHWRERMLVLTPEGEEVERFDRTGSSRMTISDNRVIFLDSEYWIVSWDGYGHPRRHVKLPVDIGFAVSGLSFHEGKLTLISRTEVITVVEIESLK